MDYLPSKRFLITALIGGIIVVGGATIARNVSFSPKKISTTEPSGQTNELLTKFAEDRDNDGLRDWEETLWNTDSQNPDTDGDGVNDGDEVTLYRDPAISGPDDTLKTSPTLTALKPQTITDQFLDTATAFYRATQIINNNSVLTETQKEGLSEINTKEIEKKVDAFLDPYSESGVIVSSHKKPKDYLNEVGEILSKNFNNSQNATPAPYIVQEAVASDNIDHLARLQPIQSSYHNALQALKKISVPSSYVGLHAELLNIEHLYEQAVHEMSYYFADPIRTTVGLTLYAKTLTRTMNFLDNLQKQIDVDGIVFDSSEGGSIFYTYFKAYLKNS